MLYSMSKPNETRSHLQYTIPPAVALTFCYYPLSTSLGVYKILFLIAVSLRHTWGLYALTLALSPDRCHLHHSVGLVSHP